MPKWRHDRRAGEFQVEKLMQSAFALTQNLFSAAGFEEENLKKVHDEWASIFEASFEKCDLPIMKKHGSFAETSWPRRINSVMNTLEKHMTS